MTNPDLLRRHVKKRNRRRRAVSALRRQLAEATAKLNYSRRVVARHSKPPSVLKTGDAPRIVGWDESGIRPTRHKNLVLGPERKVTTHYGASQRARNLAEGLKLTRAYDAFHRQKWSAGLEYHYLIPDTGELILGRSTHDLGYHVAGHNAGNIGINFFSTLGDKPTKAQAETFVWLLANAHTAALPARHRTDLDLRNADIRGHNQWPGQATNCPGEFTPENLRRIAAG